MQKEVYTTDVNKCSEAPIPDMPRRLRTAEDIARLKQDTLRTLSELPLNNWRSAYKSLLTKYPGILSYHQYTDASFENVLRTANCLDAFWKEYEPVDSGVRDELTKLQIASPDAGKKMFEKACLTVTQKDIKTMRGKFSLWFVTDNEDFINANSNVYSARSSINEEGNDYSNTDAVTYSPSRELPFPIIIIKNDFGNENVSNHLNGKTIIHEAEHAQQSILWEYKKIRQVPDKSLFNKRVKRRLREPTTFFTLAGQELLAYFSYFSLFKPEAIDSGKLAEYLEDYGNNVKDNIMPDTWDDFYPLQLRDFVSPNKIESVRQIRKGWYALVQLHNLYRKEGILEEGFSPVRMTIDVMEQFPLKSWPAVAVLASFGQK